MKSHKMDQEPGVRNQGSLTDTLGFVGPFPIQTFAGGPPPIQHRLVSLLAGVGDQLLVRKRRLLRSKIPIIQPGSLTGPTSLRG